MSSEVKTKCPRCSSENITLTKTWYVIPRSGRGNAIKIFTYRCTNCGFKFREGKALTKVVENPYEVKKWVVRRISYLDGVLYNIDLAFIKPVKKMKYCITCKRHDTYVSIFDDCLSICEFKPEDKEMLAKISEDLAVYRCKWLKEINFHNTLFRSFKCPFKEFTNILIFVDNVVVGVMSV